MTRMIWGRAGLLLCAVVLAGCSDKASTKADGGAAGEGGYSGSAGDTGGSGHAGFGAAGGGNGNTGGTASDGGTANDAGGANSAGTAGAAGTMNGDGGVGGDSGGGICAEQSQEQTADGYDVTRCHKLFDEEPRLRLPAPTSTKLYAALDRDGFTGADGVQHAFQLTLQQSDAEAKRHASALYEVTLSGDQIVGFVPWLVFDEVVFLQPLVSHAGQGTISARLPDGHFDAEHPSLPIRVTLALDASQKQILAPIQNLDSAVTGQGGECLAPLTAAADANPIAGTGPAQLVGTRVASMHSFADDEFVFAADNTEHFAGTVMSRAWFVSPLNVLKGELASLAGYTGYGHGTPGYIPTIELNLVDPGENSCVP